MLPIPTPPSFSNFKFQSIGQQPGLLKRFSESQPMQGLGDDETMSTSSENEQSLLRDSESSLPLTRPSLWQALTPDSPLAATSPVNGDFNGQASSNSFHLSVAQTTLSHPPVLSSMQKVQALQDNMPSTSPTPQPSSSAHPPVTKSPPAGDHQDSNDLGTMRLRYPSSSPDPSGTTEGSMVEKEHSCPPNGPSFLTHKYDDLRSIYAHLQSHLLNANSPNLTSATLLVESVNTKATTVLTEARRVYNFSQEALSVAQKSMAVAKVVLKAAEEVKGLAEGAKAELERILSKDTNQERGHELDQILHSFNHWISSQEADEIASRMRRAQQIKARTKKAELERISKSSQRSMIPLGHPSSDTKSKQQTTGVPTDVARSKAKQPLFLLSTPEVDVQVEPQTSTQPPISAGGKDGFAKRPAFLQRQSEGSLRTSPEVQLKGPSAVQSTSLEAEELEKRNNRQIVEEPSPKGLSQKMIIDLQDVEVDASEECEKREQDNGFEKKKETESRGRELVEALGTTGMKKKELMVANAENQTHGTTDRAKTEGQFVTAFLTHQIQEQERVVRQIDEEAKRRARKETEAREQRIHQEQAQIEARRQQEDKLRQAQAIRRQQIQADKNKTMADRAQQIRTERENRLRTSFDMNEMPGDFGLKAPQVPSTTSGLLNLSNKQPNNPAPTPVINPISSASPPPLTQCLLSETNRSHSQLNNDMTNIIKLDTSVSHPARLNPGAQLTPAPSEPVTPPARCLSLPPVVFLPPDDSSKAQVVLPFSVHRHSNDTGNVPIAKSPVLSPHAQAANLRHVVALQLSPSALATVKAEPDQNGSLLLHTTTEKPSSQVILSQIPLSSQSRQPLRNVESQAVAAPPQVSAPIQSHISNNRDSDSRFGASREPHIPLSDAGIDRPKQVHKTLIQQSPLLKATSNPSLHDGSMEEYDLSLPQSIPASASSYSRSASPFRMGPDIGFAPSQSEFDGSFDNHEHLPPFRGRTEAPAYLRWDHYSPSRSPPRISNTYRPHLSRPPSPTVAGRKRSRDYSPSPPLVRDYRDYDERRVSHTRRRSRSPPLRRSRRPSLSRSRSPPQGRPPLASRLTQGLGGGYNSPSRDSARPELLDRFTDPRTSNLPIPAGPSQQPLRPLPSRPGRNRGKRGRGGGGPVGGPSHHASLEKRISLGTTLMHRLEDPPRP